MSDVQQPMRLAQFGAPPPRRRRWPLVVAVAGVAVVVLVGVAVLVVYATRSTTPAAAPAVSAAPSSAAGRPADPSGQQACDRMRMLAGTDFTADAEKMQQVGQLAAKSTNASLYAAGLLLADSAADALAVRGRSDERERVTAMQKYVEAFDAACVRWGYRG